MPQLSSIQRPVSIEEAEEAQDSRTAVEAKAAAKNVDYDRASNFLKSNPDIFSIFSLTSHFDVPFVDIRVSGISKADSDWKRVAFGLGAGISCSVVLHQTGQEAEDVCPIGTLVALKKYSAIPPELQGEENDGVRRLHLLIWQELQVFCHPYLKQHENICKLVYIGWEETNLIPLLALELAAYGTLEDCLQNLRSYGSSLRKSHLSLDIAFALAALHSCGLIHGDIKPGNILVQSHPTREIVAKLSDFNGVGDRASYGTRTQRTFGTPIWQAPEALCREDPIDWQLADVYSFGMVFATIWSATGYIQLGGSFLDPFIPYKLKYSEKQAWVDVSKFSPDTASSGVVHLAHRAIVSEGGAEIPREFIIYNTLSSEPTSRLPLRQLLPSAFNNFGQLYQRPLVIPYSMNETLAKYVDDQSHTDVFVMKRHYTNRSRSFKEKFFRTLLAEVKSLRAAVTIPVISDLDDPWSGNAEELSRTLESRNDSLLSMLENPKLLRLMSLASEVALSYLLGLGTCVDEDLALEWFYIAACVSEGNSMFLYIALERSLLKFPNVSAPRRLWGAFAANAGFRRTTAVLQDIDPELAQIAAEVHRCRQWGRDKQQMIRLAMPLDDFFIGIKTGIFPVDSYLPVGASAKDWQESALHIYAALGNIEAVRYLVMEARANINLINYRGETPIFYALRCNRLEIANFLLGQGAVLTHISTENCTVMHTLSCMDDHSASTLAPVLVPFAAELLAVECNETSYPYQDNFTRGEGIPLFWAVARMRVELFKNFLSLHKQFEIKFDLMTLLKLLASRNLHEMIEIILIEYSSISKLQAAMSAENDQPGAVLLDSQNRSPEIVPSSQETLSLEYRLAVASIDDQKTSLTVDDYSNLLCQALDLPAEINLCRRYLHGSNFRSAKTTTVKLLLDAGANPLGNSGIKHEDALVPLSIIIFTGDGISLPLILDHFETKSIDPLPHLTNDVLFGGLNALLRSIYADSKENFMLLVEKYPSLIDIVGAEGRGALHAAATQKWAGYTAELLRRGADRYVRSNDRATPFIWSVMRNSSLEVANLLAEGADMSVILGPDIQSGFTAFGKVISAMTFYKMDIPMSRLRYLVDTFGKPDLYINKPGKVTAFRSLLLQQTPPTERAHLALEGALLKYLLEIFSDKVDFLDDTGRTPLHYAVQYGNLSAVKILLEHGASVNMEVQDVNPDHKLAGQKNPVKGYTALNLAISIKKEGPGRDILRGGAREIEQWQRNIQGIINLLLENGGESGSGGGWAAFDVDIEAGTMDNVVVTNWGQVRRGDRTSDGQWPKRLPWEGTEPNPFPPRTSPAGSDDSDDDGNDNENRNIEIIEQDGLSRPISHKGLSLLQTMVGAISPHVLTGNHVIPPPAPPQGYSEQLDKQLKDLKKLRPVQRKLPKGWEARITEDEMARVYFVDHNTKTTTWNIPVVEPVNEQDDKKAEMMDDKLEIPKDEEARLSETAEQERT